MMAYKRRGGFKIVSSQEFRCCEPEIEQQRLNNRQKYGRRRGSRVHKSAMRGAAPYLALARCDKEAVHAIGDGIDMRGLRANRSAEVALDLSWADERAPLR